MMRTSVRRWSCVVAAFAVLTVVLAGCKGRQPETGEGPAAPASAPASAQAPSPPQQPALAPEVKEDYDTHYAQGLVLLADKKYEEALAEFQKAKAISDNVEVAAQIEKIKQITGGDQEAKQLLKEVETLRQAGRLEDASKKAAEGVEKYWGTTSGPALADAKKAIDGDIARQTADKQALADKVYQRAQEDYKQGNLRNAYVSLGEATKYSQDSRITALYEDAKSRMALYDESVQAADACMKNPDSYEDAITSLEAAQKVWDTPEVRSRLQAAQDALKTRRERIAVVDFDTKGEFDVPNAGGAVAELLLPRFQGKYDIIERAQLAKLLQEQNLQMSDLAEPSAAVENMSKIKRVRYLVTGSLMRFGGVRVTARMVQVNSGLIGNTGQVSPPSIQDIDAYLDDLAAQLTLTPEEYRAYQARRTPPPAPAPPMGYIPTGQATPIFEGIVQRDVEYVDEGAPISEEPPSSWREEQFKRELYDSIMDLGQEFMAKRQFYEAGRQFEMALRVFPGDARAMSLLSDAYRLMTYTPPPPGPPRDRIAVLDFIAFGDPGYPFAGHEVADLLASYLSRHYDVVDRGELFWYMRRMHVTVRQLLHSRQRLMWFGRLFNIRYFIIGYLTPSRSFDVAVNVMDAQDGVVQSRVRMHVYNADDLRYRMPELSHALFLGHNDRRVWIEECDRRYELYRNGQNCMRENKFGDAMRIFGELMNVIQPDRDRFYGAESRRCYQQAQWHQSLARPRQPVIVISTDPRALEREHHEADRRAEEMRRQLERNYRAALDDGQAAMAAGDYAAAMRAFAAAMNLRKTDEAEDAYRAAKKRADQQKALWAADSKTEHRYLSLMEAGRKMLLLARYAEAIKNFESALAIKRTPEAQAALADAQRHLDETRRHQEAAAADRERREAERAAQMYATYLSAGRGDMQRQRYPDAVTSFTRALALKKTPEAQAGLQEAQQRLADQQQKERDLATQRQVERKGPAPLPGPEKEKPKPPASPTPRSPAYDRLMAEGRDLMEKQQYVRATRAFAQAYALGKTDEARAAYDEAVRKNDEAKTLPKPEKEKEPQAAEEARKRKLEEERKTRAERDAQAEEQAKKDKAERDRLLKEKQEKMDAAGKAKEEADKRALEERGKQEADKRAKEAQEAEKRGADQKARLLDQAYQRYMDAGQTNMRRKRYESAMKDFGEALNVKKTDEAQAAYNQAKAALDAAKAGEETARQEEQLKAKEQAEQKAASEKQRELDRQRKDAERKAAEEKAKQEAEARRAKQAELDAEARRAKQVELDAKRAAEEEARKKRPQEAEEKKAAGEPKEEPKPSREPRAVAPQPPEPPQGDQGQEADRGKKKVDARAAQAEAAYQKQMNLGSELLNAQRFADAARAFGLAYKLKPTDEAKAALDAAQQKLQDQQKQGGDQEKPKPRKRK